MLNTMAETGRTVERTAFPGARLFVILHDFIPIILENIFLKMGTQDMVYKRTGNHKK